LVQRTKAAKRTGRRRNVVGRAFPGHGSLGFYHQRGCASGREKKLEWSSVTPRGPAKQSVQRR
jgi:hypothetical protein